MCCVYVYMRICVYVYMCVCIYVYTYICVHVCIFMCICLYVYMFICIFTERARQDGCTALMEAAEENHEETVRLLEALGADWRLTDIVS